MTGLRLRSASLSKAGARAVNEDACGVREDAGRGLWIVADGLGGHGSGEIAAGIAVETLLDALDPAAGLGPDRLADAFVRVARALRDRQEAEPARRGMRTTVVVMAIDGSDARWAHVGDSRLYWVRGGRIRAQTEDHSVPQALVKAGELAPEAVRFHEDRNRLLRTLGEEKPPRPTLLETPLVLQPDDAFLLCSDGFWECVTEGDMEIALAKAADPTEWLQRMERRLIARALADQDNYTAIGVWVDASGAVG
jgi:serine/threonine protein phosphatase PrpC